ncbi:MAG: FAD binding domain-containing protein [Enhydrobacter sp.]|nr:MAG: FAD binding domain-containing protein [Enhydrobacter sp.]
MKPARFDYARPASVSEAVMLLARHGTDAAVLAGGQSLMPMMAMRLATPGLLVDIGRLPDLDRVEPKDDHLVIGALATHAALLASPLVRASAPLLAEALPHVAHPAIRNRGTLGGSLALADPAAELPACMVCLDAEITLVSLRGERVVLAGDFFRGVYGTDREPDELLVSVAVPVAREGWRFSFGEVAHRHGDFALAGLAFGARREGRRIVESRVAYCGIEDAPRRLLATESCLAAGRSFVEAREVARRELEPGSSRDAPAAWRRRLAGALLERAGRTA